MERPCGGLIPGQNSARKFFYANSRQLTLPHPVIRDDAAARLPTAIHHIALLCVALGLAIQAKDTQSLGCQDPDAVMQHHFPPPIGLQGCRYSPH